MTTVFSERPAKLPGEGRQVGVRPTLRGLCDSDLDPLFWNPERRGVASTWWGHVPFAHWLVQATRPGLFVELGTYAGVSYTAFCMAAQRSGSDTRCFAVDTWQGDPQSGVYGDEIYNDFRIFHDARYAAFSTLLRCSFDEALNHFVDGSVDLLHIDGYHTYEAVRHDFEAWLPKLSGRGVVLFHDTAVHFGDFGVWRLWRELSERYPHFEFHHSYGLGVLAVGAAAPEPVIDLCELGLSPMAAVLRERVALTGERWAAEIRERDLAAVLGARERALAEQRTAAAAEAEKERIEKQWAEDRAEWQRRLAEVMIARDQSEAARRRSQEELARVVSSTAWQMTYPLRRIAAKIPPRLRRRLRQLAYVVWWSATLQLGVKLRERRSRLAAIQARPPGEPAEPATTAAPGRPGSAAQSIPDPTPVLGINLPLVIRSVVLGIVTYNPDAAEFRRLIASAQIALERSGITDGTILVIDNGAETDSLTAGVPRVRRLPSDGNIGFGAGHNRLMAAAFADGAEVYIAVNPDGLLHPDAVTALLQEVQATQDHALVEALQFPEEHPKFYDPATLDTAWASGACLAIPKKIYETIGGFDEIFFLYCEDVDLSWRARAAGFSVKVCPRALFFHRVTNRAPDPLTERRFRESGVILARKWRNPAFEQTLLSDLRRSGYSSPVTKPPMVPLEWQAVADFSHLFHFAPARW